MDDTDSENQLDEESSDQDVDELAKEPDEEIEPSEEETRARRQTFFRARKFSKSPVDAYQV